MLLPCQLTTTASLRVLLQHCWQDPGCVPCKCSIVGAGHGQELLFNCSKVKQLAAIRDARESRDVLVFFLLLKVI
ncbi:hypothetical protein SORBI_3006G066000 [Sorghum bicolor]|uniref:Uncharacterized protein n=1 Tax=Sorghum bicolor TaxID=4558 RepID=A0A1Z5RCK5_SORBI|nr:hypothetical protein SORBI_3006G066000 [Sorghum bicolor]